MSSRIAKLSRKTKETDITVEWNLDGTGEYRIETGVGFFDHMLTHVARHGRFDLTVKAQGDLHVDAHHTVEDVGICLGQALDKALGDKVGIERFGNASVPMEDSLATVSVDLCGRSSCVYNAAYRSGKIGDFDVELVEEFLRSFCHNAKLNLHVNVAYGTNNHHIAEAIFKGLGRSLRDAVRRGAGEDVPSTKGML